jgi:hypothetical protein
MWQFFPAPKKATGGEHLGAMPITVIAQEPHGLSHRGDHDPKLPKVGMQLDLPEDWASFWVGVCHGIPKIFQWELYTPLVIDWVYLQFTSLNRKLDEHRVMEGTSLPYQATYHIFARMVPPNAFSGPAWLLCQTGRPCVPNCAGPSNGCSSLWPIYQLYSFTYLCVCVWV